MEDGPVLSVKEKPTVVLHFVGAFPSDRNLKATKNIGVNFFIYGNNSCTLYQRIPGYF
jgi:hypothetical protein